MAVDHILDAKIVNNEEKYNRVPFVAPKDGCGDGLLIACLIDALAE